MNAILEMELDDLEQLLEDAEDIQESEDGRFKIKDLDSANWAFRKLKAIEHKKMEIEELARKEIAPYELEISRINEWKNNELKTFDRSINFFNFLLEEYYRGERVKDPKFKLTTPHGKVTSRKQQDKWTYEDEVVLSSLKKTKLNKFIKVKEDVNKADLKKETTVLEYEYGYIAVFKNEVLGKVSANDENGIEYVNIDTGEIYNTQEENIDLYDQVVVYKDRVIEGVKVEPQPDSVTIKVEV